MQRVKTWDFAAKFLIRKSLLPINRRDSMSKFGTWTKNQLIDLGPTFIKLGQAASVRKDVFPLEFVEQLESLQDQVPPMKPEDVLEVLGNHPFESFELEAYKSASLGQVHKAVLSNGTLVMVKIQRLGIRETITTDIQNILEILNFLDSLGVSTGPSARAVFQESVKYLLDEIDYVNECTNARRFRRNFKDTPWLVVPRVYPDLSTDKILVMEFVPSVKIMDSVGVNRKRLSEALFSCFVNQVMLYGFFHADPHPGNLGITSDGKLVIYDYGLAVPISQELTTGMKNLLGAIIQRDTRKMVDILIDLDIIIPTADRAEIALFFEALLGYLETMNGESFSSDMMQNELSATLAREKPFVLPSSFVFLARAFSMIDGTCRELDPEFTFYTYLEPMVQKEVSDVVDLRKMAMITMEMPARIKSINASMVEMEKSRSTMKRSFERIYDLIQMSILLNLFVDTGHRGVSLLIVPVILLARKK